MLALVPERVRLLKSNRPGVGSVFFLTRLGTDPYQTRFSSLGIESNVADCIGSGERRRRRRGSGGYPNLWHHRGYQTVTVGALDSNPLKKCLSSVAHPIDRSPSMYRCPIPSASCSSRMTDSVRGSDFISIAGFSFPRRCTSIYPCWFEFPTLLIKSETQTAKRHN